MFNFKLKVMRDLSKIIVFALLLICNITWSQTDTLKVSKQTFNLEEALKNPLDVKTLNLSNQNIVFEPNFFSKFENLEYLSLKTII